jgi:exopolysaccharide production protein ExoZ
LPSLDEIAKSLLFIFYSNPVTNEPTPIVTVGWTLNYEIVFYLLFALSIRLSVSQRIIAIASIFLILCVFRPIVSQENALLYRMTSPQPLEFVAGMVLAHWRHHLLRLPILVGLGAIAAGLAGLSLVDSGFTRFVQFAPCATFIVAGGIVCEPKLRRDFLIPRLLGDSSYSLYLTHPLVLEVLKIVPVNPADRLAAAVATALSCVAISLAFYRCVELPGLRFFRARLKQRTIYS